MLETDKSSGLFIVVLYKMCHIVKQLFSNVYFKILRFITPVLYHTNEKDKLHCDVNVTSANTCTHYHCPMYTYITDHNK